MPSRITARRMPPASRGADMAPGTRRKATLHPAPATYCSATKATPSRPTPSKKIAASRRLDQIRSGAKARPKSTVAPPNSAKERRNVTSLDFHVRKWC